MDSGRVDPDMRWDGDKIVSSGMSRVSMWKFNIVKQVGDTRDDMVCAENVV